MLQVIGATVFLVLASTVLMLLADRLPPAYAAAIPFLIPLLAFAGAAWLFAPARRCQP